MYMYLLNDLDISTEIKLDPDRQTVTFRFSKILNPGPHRLKLAFTGKINKTAEGLFLIRYKTPSGRKKSLFCTDMEPANARQVFPLWDEPVYRGIFEISVQVPESFTAVSNMPIESERPLGHGNK